MANPKLPGISESEQALLYAKLNEYNRGRASFKEAGVYLVVLPRPGKPNYSLWLYSPLPEKQSILYIHDLSPDINESLRIASTMFYYSRRCLILMDYNEKRMQSNGDDLIFFGKYRGHFLHEILKVDPAYLSWIAYKPPLKRQGFIWWCCPDRESPTIPFGSTLPCPKSNRFSIYTIYLRISTSPCG